MLNRDTKNGLNQLQEIFDKAEVKERQELATEFAKLGAEKIGDIAKENHWSNDDPRRALLHGILGGITAQLGGNNVLSGAVAAGGMESLQPLYEYIELSKPLSASGFKLPAVLCLTKKPFTVYRLPAVTSHDKQSHSRPVHGSRTTDDG